MSQSINVEIETEVLTPGGLAEVVAAILEFLLYQRHQIDLVYSTFRNFVNEWLNNELSSPSSLSSDSVQSYMLDRQRAKAIQTKESISAMRKLIMEAFDKHEIKSLRFLFGSTISTPKEVYNVILPIASSSCLHLTDHHSLQKIHLNRLILSLITHNDLKHIFSKSLYPTNIFLEFEILESTKNVTTKPVKHAFPTIKKTQFPRTCKVVHFYIHHKIPAGSEDINFNCCRELEVFNGECLEPASGMSDNLQNQLVAGSTWWESEIIVKGFREKLIKGRSIWNK